MLQLFRPPRARREAKKADPAHARANHPGLAILLEHGRLGQKAIDQALARAEETRQPLPVVLTELELQKSEAEAAAGTGNAQ